MAPPPSNWESARSVTAAKALLVLVLLKPFTPPSSANSTGTALMVLDGDRRAATVSLDDVDWLWYREAPPVWHWFGGVSWLCSGHEVLELIWRYKLGVGDHCTGTALMVLTGYRGPLGVATNRMLLPSDRGATTARKCYGGVTQKVIRGRGVLEEESLKWKTHRQKLHRHIY